jgi:PAS domain S-box-containing protein
MASYKPPAARRADNVSRVRASLAVYAAVVIVFVAIGPMAFSSGWVSSSDFHACIEICGSLIAIIAAIACLVYYFGLESRYFLIIGLGFLVCGGEHLVHGIFSFKQLFADTEVDFSRFIPGTYTAARLVLAIMIMTAVLVERTFKRAKNLKRQAAVFSGIALAVGAGTTLLALALPLPRFIYPEFTISRPVDFISALLFAVAFALVLRRFLTRRDIFSASLLACILLNTGGQIYMSFSRQLYDVFFDIAHFANILSYCMPVLGIALQGLEEMKKGEISESRFRTLFESSSDAVMLLDEKGFLDCNSATVRIFGCADKAEFCSKHPADLSPATQPCGADSIALANERIAAAIENGTNFFEWTHKRLDTNQTFPAEVLLNTMELDGRQVLQAVVRDITLRKQVEEEIARERTHLKAILEAAPTCMMLIDEDIVIRNVNNVAAKLVDHEEAQLIGIRPGEALHCIHATDDEKGCGYGPACSNCLIRGAIEEVLRTGQPRHNVEVQVTLDIKGQHVKVWLNVSAEPLTLEARRHVILALEDITRRKENELKLRKSVADLEEFNRLMVGREMRIIEMKKEVNTLLAKLGREPRYQSVI